MQEKTKGKDQQNETIPRGGRQCVRADRPSSGDPICGCIAKLQRVCWQQGS